MLPIVTCRPAASAARPRTTFGVVTLALVAAVVTGCAGSLGGSSAQNACPVPIDAPTLYPGDTWTFQYEDGKRWGQTYGSRSEDGLLRGRGAKAEPLYFYDQTHTLRKVLHQGMALTVANQDFPLIGQPELVFPLTVGKTWAITWYTPYLVLLRRDMTVVGCEEVTVPAGTFLAVRIEASDVFTHTPGWASRRHTMWYAPAVKYWVKCASTWSSQWEAVKGFELISYKIDRGKP
jgi:hypothetical protein